MSAYETIDVYNPFQPNSGIGLKNPFGQVSLTEQRALTRTDSTYDAGHYELDGIK